MMTDYFSLSCGGSGYTIHICDKTVSSTHTHTHIAHVKVVNSDEALWIVPKSISWHSVTTEHTGRQVTPFADPIWNLPVYFFAASHESIIISK